MNNWKIYKLGEIVDYVNGGAWPATAYSENENGIPVVRVTDIKDFTVDLSTCKFLKLEFRDKYLKHKVNSGDLVVCTVGSHPNQQSSVVGKTALIPNKADGAFLNQNAVLLKAKESFVDKRWLGLFSRSFTFKEHVEIYARGSANQARLAISSLLDMAVLLPSLPEQQKIAAILCSLDDKIELNCRMNQTLEQIAAALFKKYFVDDIDPDSLPEGWRKGIIEDLFILQRGFDLPNTKRVNGIYPVFAAGGFNGYHSEFMVKAPGVTTGRSGVIGNVFYISKDFWPLNTSLYVKEYFNSNPLHAYYTLKYLDLAGLNGGSAVPTLNRNHVHSLEALIPPKALLVGFEETTAILFEKIYNNSEENKTLAQLRDTLLPKLMSGEIDVSAINLNEPLHAQVSS